MADNKLQLPAGIEGDWTFAQFDDVCTHFSCTLEGKTRSGEWIISSDDPINFFWLGGNMSMRGSGTFRTIPAVDMIAASSSKHNMLLAPEGRKRYANSLKKRNK